MNYLLREEIKKFIICLFIADASLSSSPSITLSLTHRCQDVTVYSVLYETHSYLLSLAPACLCPVQDINYVRFVINGAEFRAQRNTRFVAVVSVWIYDKNTNKLMYDKTKYVGIETRKTVYTRLSYTLEMCLIILILSR